VSPEKFTEKKQLKTVEELKETQKRPNKRMDGQNWRQLKGIAFREFEKQCPYIFLSLHVSQFLWKYYFAKS